MELIEGVIDSHPEMAAVTINDSDWNKECTIHFEAQIYVLATTPLSLNFKKWHKVNGWGCLFTSEYGDLKRHDKSDVIAYAKEKRDKLIELYPGEEFRISITEHVY